MNQIKIFENPAFGKVRTIIRDQQPWFVAADVCRALDIGNSSDAISRLDDDEKGVASTDTLGGEQSIRIINEPGLYSLVLGSRKPEAKLFKRWITHEVIPDIRRHGMYANDAALENLLSDPDSMITVLERYKAEWQHRQALEAKVEQDAPKVLFADTVESSEQSILVGVLAKMLRQKGIEIGQNRLFELLRRDGYLCSTEGRWNMPTQRAMEMQLLEVRERSINNPDGSVRLTLTTMVTGKGQVYFVNKYRRGAGCCATAL